MERRRRPAPHRALLLACAAAVPALLLTACSAGGDSGSDSSATSGSGAAGTSDGKGSTGGAAPSSTAATAPEKFSTLPAACDTVTKATISALVPKAKSANGKEAQSDDISSRSGCSWTGNGKDGYQYRWLSVTFQRFASAPGSPADEQAEGRFTDQVAELGKASGTKTTQVSGLGDQASSVAGKATVAKVTSQNDTLLVRTGNVVVIVEYDGAGLEGKDNPSASTVNSGALRAAKDAVAAVAADKQAGTGTATDADPGKSPSASASTKK